MIADYLRTESDRIEWKVSADDSEKIIQAVCAMANDLGGSARPGIILVGVDKGGKVVGVGDIRKLDDIEQRLSNQPRSTKMVPTPSFDLRHEELEGKHVLVLSIEPYPVPPLVQVNSVPWIRQGTTTRRATDADVARLRERRPESTRPFDQRTHRLATVQDLAEAPLRAEYLAAKEGIVDAEVFPEFTAWLTQRQMGQLVDGVWRPNPTALLIHGISPDSWYPGAKIEFVRYGGGDVDSAVASRKSIGGTLPEQLEALWAQMEAHLASGVAEVRGPVETYRPDYPSEALKELARNLVQHRQYEGNNAPSRVEWFDDRIEFSNPGGPFGRASDGEFGEHSDYRNPTLTARLVELGYVQKLGRGIRRVRKHLEQNGNPPMKVEIDGYTRVILFKRP